MKYECEFMNSGTMGQRTVVVREVNMATLQVKGMDDDLYRALAARAAQ